MARPVVLSNGRLMVGLDEHGFVHDFFYPHVGQENMTSARQMHHKIGVWVNGTFSWLDDGSWSVGLDYKDGALVGSITYQSDRFGLSISSDNFVDTEEDVFCRRFTIKNNSSNNVEVRLFFHQVFQISRSGRGDTALFVKSKHPYILSYQGRISFVTSLRHEDGSSFDQYAVGNYMIEGKSGTYSDAEDGQLSGNNVEHGGVDSVIRTCFHIAPGETSSCDYWVSASSKTYHEATSTHRTIAVSGLETNHERTVESWQRWLSKSQPALNRLDEKYRKLFRNSLLVIKAHIDAGGGVLASGDSSIYNYGRDYYSYIWPRDASYALLPLVRLGYTDEALSFLTFCRGVMHPRGYLHHKYQADGAIGSTWHPMVQEGRPELNIQEDETAIMIILFAHTAAICQDKVRLEELYAGLIRPCLEFLASYIDHDTGLPHATYDLWEQSFLSTPYSASVVLEALRYGVDMASERGDHEDAERWRYSADTIAENFNKYFDTNNQWFAKGIRLKHDEQIEVNSMLDASTFYALTHYRPLPLKAASVEGTIRAFMSRLVNTSPVQGVVRYAGDNYMLSKPYPGNPWFVCTFWLAQYYAETGEREKALEITDWALKYALPSGVMSEQIDPENGYPLGVAPLVWSHAELINTLLDIYPLV